MKLIDRGIFQGMPHHRARVLYADPPWRNEIWGKHPEHDNRKPKYPTMTVEDIMAMGAEVNELCWKDCHCFMWTTHTHLPAAFRVMSAWGFRYSTVAFTWVKTRPDGSYHLGLGKTTRKNTEYVLLGRLGSPRRNSKNIPELLVSPVREHSRKPDEARRRIEAYADGPYVELFGRQQWPNWQVWGNQSNLFAPPSDDDLQGMRGNPPIHGGVLPP